MTATTLNILLATLTESLKSAVCSLPEKSTIAPPTDGISLLDTKNELLLSYLQNLVFLIILKLRDVSSSGSSVTDADEKQNGHEAGSIREEVVKKLVELRVYLEKGVKPLEGRLRYQIDKVVRAAEEDAAKNAAISQPQARLSNGKASGQGSRAANGHKRKSGSESESESDMSDASSASGNSDKEAYSAPAIDPLAYRPNPSALTLPARSTPQTSTSKSDNIYRPPRITPTALPTTTSQRSTSTAKRPSKSATLDEFVATELSAAPMAEPSIGSTIVGGGRRSKSAKEREMENERSRYEERNYVRLPTEGKKKKGKGGKERNEYGDEEWRGLGEGAERVVSLTRKGSSGGGVLERSRKRTREDGVGGSGDVRMGERFEKRRKGVEKRRAGRR
ncbi:hypothetical protein MMC30_006521 [Trapelia coarctata]|nr:hypothetical protein [Trapelia coarctata]